MTAGFRSTTRGALGKCLLVVILAVLQIADVATTNRALAADPAHWELNPAMAWFMAHLGAEWWLPKLALVGFAVLAAPRIQARWLALAALLYVAIVANNLAYL